ncbi:MAG TPA: cytochrome c [Candidatus Acidoferrum sp.]|nr:cytochrome c [Candidatus Acidoferrum sp.]
MLRLRQTTAVSSSPGCPILARPLRKSGIPRMTHAWDVLTVGILLSTVALFSACRLDMQVQPKQNPLSRSDFFSDQRSERPPVEGTVARGQLREDTYFYTGRAGSSPGDYMPFPVTKEVLERGRERYNIYCAPCHSRTGDGNGFIPSRGFSRKPPSYHIERLQKAPLGYFYDVMTNGFGIMPDYASQIIPADRWKVVAYIRALQLSQNATKADVPAGQAVPSEPPQFRGQPGSGATLPEIDSETTSHSEEHK